MSTQTVRAIFQNGLFRPFEKVDLPENAEVEFEPRKVAGTSAHLTNQPNGPRGVPAEQVRGLAAGDSSPPDDETVKRWIDEHRMET